MFEASLPDLLRLLAVPAFAWIALRDIRTRRVPGGVWYPLLGLGLLALAADAVLVLGEPDGLQRLLILTVVSVGLLAPLAFAFYWFGAFGRADAKGIATLALLFPSFPTYEVLGTTLPVVVPNLPVFALTILVDGMLVGMLYPVALAGSNLFAGRTSPIIFVGRPVPTDDLLERTGKLLESDGGLTLAGLDLDALRMYLRWRDLSLADLRENPDAFRRPSTLPGDPNPPTDGAVDPDADPDPGGAPAASFDGEREADPWGAEAFLDDIEGSAYGTTPEGLRTGLDLVAERDTVWISPGIPFLVPLFGGLLVALTVGDVFFALLAFVGVV